MSRLLRWPRVRPLGLLLRSPAHRVMRMLHLTRFDCQVQEASGGCESRRHANASAAASDLAAAAGGSVIQIS